MVLVCKGADNRIAWERLDDMVQTVFDIYGPTITECKATNYPVSNESDAPAYEISFETLV